MWVFPKRNFNSRPSARGDEKIMQERDESIYISIHAPPRGATSAVLAGINTMREFQFTPLREGRRAAAGELEEVNNFNSRPSARGDDYSKENVLSWYGFQFTPLREGRPNAHTLKIAFEKISIHAPPRGATEAVGGAIANQNISIHAPPRGATRRPATARTHARDFNSRPSARGDAGGCWRLWRALLFQFTPLREGRHISEDAPKEAVTFQFTPLREGRLRMDRRFCRRPDFNSRPSARGDINRALCGAPDTVFQFTPLREGRRRWRDGNVSARRISIHAPPRGATLTISLLYCACAFQFTPLREGRPCLMENTHSPTSFQFTPLREGRRNSDIQCNRKLQFQFTPLREGRLFQPILPQSIIIFQFTPLREGRLCARRKARKSSRFQFTPLREGRREAGSRYSLPLTFQFTPLREGRPGPPRHEQAAATTFQFTPLREGRQYPA